MVFLTAINFFRSRGPDEFWRKRRVFKLTAKYFGRRRNVYCLALRSLQKALTHATLGRKLRKEAHKQLWVDRIEAACHEHGTSYKPFMENLARCSVALNHKVLADIAIYEPRTFKCLTDVAKAKNFLENPRGLNSLISPPDGVITRGML